MTPERLAEIRERRDDQPWFFSGMIDELIDALTSGRARAERALELAQELANDLESAWHDRDPSWDAALEAYRQRIKELSNGTNA